MMDVGAIAAGQFEPAVHNGAEPEVQAAFMGIVGPVIKDMPQSGLRDALLAAFREEEASLFTIEECFRRLTARKHSPESLKRFFQSWSQTNNSAAAVAGLASRITLAAKNKTDAARLKYYAVVDSLQRITDEDLGANGGVLHSELYYRMATTLCGDDSWQSKEYCVGAAKDFRDLLLHQRLRDRQILKGLLHTLIHEVYTHGEVELIHAMCQAWLPAHMGFDRKTARRTLAWITVHTGGTESTHFRHATDAVEHFCEASGVLIDPDAAKDLFKTYLRHKAAVMEELLPILQ